MFLKTHLCKPYYLRRRSSKDRVNDRRQYSPYKDKLSGSEYEDKYRDGYRNRKEVRRVFRDDSREEYRDERGDSREEYRRPNYDSQDDSRGIRAQHRRRKHSYTGTSCNVVDQECESLLYLE